VVNGRLDAAYEYCERLARDHYENFPVASLLLPAAMRPHIAAVYAFARVADDFADEPGRDAAERLRLLNEWEERLTAAEHGAVEPGDHIFLATADTLKRKQLPAQLFHDLVSAFRQDVTVHRYDAWEGVFDYCRRSANPVGRLVLRIAGIDDVRADRASDAVCTALQLANFWQDFGRDWRAGRLYVPVEEISRHGARIEDLDGGTMTTAWRSTMHACVARTRALFEEGRPVADVVAGRLRWELRATWLGGMRILDRIEGMDFDTLHNRPTLSARDVVAIVPQLIRWRTAARSASHAARL
jgi:hydroxysqualene synthase